MSHMSTSGCLTLHLDKLLISCYTTWGCYAVQKLVNDLWCVGNISEKKAKL